MKRTILSVMVATLAFSNLSFADVSINFEAIDVRGNGIFGPLSDNNGDGSFSLVDINGGALGTVTADPLAFNISVMNQDFDGDGMTNDSFTFTLMAAGGGMAQRAWGQGIDTGFGQLNDVTLSVTNVMGTTDQGRIIQFDGFTGAAAGAGGNSANNMNGTTLNRTVDITTAEGTNTASFMQMTNGFQFFLERIDFNNPQSSVTFTNSGGDFGSIVAREYDFQFSSVTVPEPSACVTLLLISAMGLRRRQR